MYSVYYILIPNVTVNREHIIITHDNIRLRHVLLQDRIMYIPVYTHYPVPTHQRTKANYNKL